MAEGVGGLLVPLTPGYLVRDLAVDLGLPVVIAARTGLGTINHTLLTVEAARAAGLEVAGVVMTPWPATPEPIEVSNVETVERLSGVQVTGLPGPRPSAWPRRAPRCRWPTGSPRLAGSRRRGRLLPLALVLAQLHPADLPGQRLRQVVDELDLARIGVRGVALAHVALDLVGQLAPTASWPPASTMNALTMSPRRSSGEATAAASCTAGCSTQADSTSNGPIR